MRCKHCNDPCKRAAEKTERKSLSVWICPNCDDRLYKHIKIDPASP